jgi:RimJ/RimL family protein N-acetyltransferase
MITHRDLTPDDLDELVRWRNDPDVNRYLSERLMNEEEAGAWFQRLRRNPKIWLKAIQYDDRLVGYGVVESIDETNRKCELAMVIGEKDLWGCGIGRTILVEMLRYAFDELRMHRVWAVAIRGNDRSERLLKNAGFSYEGTMRGAISRAGTFTDLLIYSLLEDEYRAKRRRAGSA